MSEKDFDKGYKSGFKFGKEVANEKWLNKVKQARKDIENEIKFWNEPIKHDVKPVVNMRKAKANSYKHCLEMIDKLITESEE